jgi:hypothetical protein
VLNSVQLFCNEVLFPPIGLSMAGVRSSTMTKLLLRSRLYDLFMFPCIHTPFMHLCTNLVAYFKQSLIGSTKSLLSLYHLTYGQFKRAALLLFALLLFCANCFLSSTCKIHSSCFNVWQKPVWAVGKRSFFV